MKKISLKELGESIIGVPTESMPVIIAIDGPAGAGKSYFSRKLASVLPDSFVVPMDDFVSWDSIENGGERAIQQLFVPLKTKGKARYQARDWVNDRFGEGLCDWKDVPESDYVIAEGVGSARRAFSPYVDKVIWVDSPEAVCMQRGIERDGEELEQRWNPFKLMESAFFSEDQTEKRIDVIVDGVNGDIFNV